jgi:YD repeat-containing protein
MVYTYDLQGHLTGEETYTDQGVRLDSRRYDAQGRLVEWVTDQGGIRQTYTYNAQGNCVETETQGHEPGLGIGGEISAYDAQGTLLSQITYYIPEAGLEEGSQKVLPPSTDLFAYEWDTHDNWVKQGVDL